MINTFLSNLFYLGIILVSFSTEQVIASGMDLAVNRLDGKSRLFYREGNFVIIKYCENSYVVFGKTSAEARNNCRGRFERSVPVDVFKQIYLQRFKNLKDIRMDNNKQFLRDLLTKEEFDAYCDYYYLNNTPRLIEELSLEIERISRFITANGPDRSYLQRKAMLESHLRESRKISNLLASAQSKIEADRYKKTELLAKLVESNGSQTGLMIYDQSSPEVSDFYLPSSPSRESCGRTGTLDERVRDCSQIANSRTNGFLLVTQVNGLFEGLRDGHHRVWQDPSTGLLWGDGFEDDEEDVNFLEAEEICRKLPRIEGKTWRLPTIDELKAVNSRGVGALFSKGSGKVFWTSSKAGLLFGDQRLIMQEGRDKQGRDIVFRSKPKSELSVMARCVAR